jgi:small subunit ribosomal protein S7
MNFKAFDLYDLSEVKVEDFGLKRYIDLTPKLVIKSSGREREKFGKSKVNVIERLANMLTVPGKRGKKHKIITNWASGKHSQRMKTVLEAFKMIQKETGKNPVAVLVRAIENSAPKDEVTVIEYGGARYPQAVDCAPLRRVNQAIHNIVHGAYDKSFNKKINIAEALAKELILASENNQESFAVKKRIESEKQADAAR